ncbi:MAG TPA: 2-C-methyl-D-erythritol 4-phosphate cytidylyltransferase [Candidatus Elarobacter sp.]|nr:2-C-methyl-D-erythritol 4-phosphate cytidylyltransferase [Candidatus Elarobacter sp.]
MTWGAIVVAAGHGTRFGRPKQLIAIAGRPMVAWSIDAFASMAEIAELVVVTEPEHVEAMQQLADERVIHGSVTVVRGGATRQASARAGLDALSEDVTAVLVHDGARPLVRTADVRDGMRPVRPGIASLLAAQIVDTVKVAGPDGKVTRTLDRSELWVAQTPQFAMLADLRRAHADAARRGETAVTDDAALLERAGCDVLLVPANHDNFKVTVPEDLTRAEAVLRERGDQSAEEDMLVVECFVDPTAVDAVLLELEARAARVDEIDRDLPSAAVVRAYLTNAALRGFGARLQAVAGANAMYTVTKH